MKTLLGLAVLASFSITGSAYALSREPIERTGAVYHQATCSRDVAVGQARCHAHVVVDQQGNVLKGKAAATASNAAPSGYSPSDLRSAYNVTTTGSSKTIVAIVDAYGYPNAEADLAVYRKQYGLPACTTANGCFIKMNETGGTSYPAFNASWAQEQALDLAMVSAMCPNCRIMLIQTANTYLNEFANAVNLAVLKGATVVSNSYGGSETGTSSIANAYNHPGVAITASAGDSGYGVQFPASAPTVIGVGGTHLTRSNSVARGWSESAWASTGAGCSKVFSKPSWQTDKLCTKRLQNDISAVADPSTGVAVYGPTGSGTNSGWLVMGGTSVASPLIAGIYGATGARPSGASKLWAASSNSALNDVTSGSDGNCGGLYFCTAQVGPDGPTGRGTPNGTAAF